MNLPTYQDWIKEQYWTDNHYVSGILPCHAGDYILIAGKSGIGKSVMATHLCFSIATGTPFLGFETQSATVGYAAFEGSTANIKDRLTQIAKNYPPTGDRFRFNLLDPIPLGKSRDTYMKMFAECKVVVLDNLRQITHGKYLDPAYAADFIKDLQAMLDELGAVAVITHHIKKANDAYLVEPGDLFSLKGATEYADAATTVLLMEYQRQQYDFTKKKFGKKNKDKLVLYFAKTRVSKEELKPIELVRNRVTCSFDPSPDSHLDEDE
jgi:RecA-family ATPase